MIELNRKMMLGISFVFFGILYLVYEIGVIPSDSFLYNIFNAKIFPIYLAVIFLIGKDYKVAAVMALISVAVWVPNFARFMFVHSNLFIPLLMIAVGVLLIYKVRKGKSDKDISEDDIDCNS